VLNFGSFLAPQLAAAVNCVDSVLLNTDRRADCAPKCCTCSVGEGPVLKAIVGNDGDGDEAIKEDCRLTIADL